MIEAGEHAAVVEALEANEWELFRAAAAAGGVELHDDGEVLWGATNVPVPAFNGVRRTRLRPERVDEAIADVRAIFDGRETPWSWCIGPASWPLDLSERLVRHGFTETERLPGMAVSIEGGTAVPDERLRFEEILSGQSLEAFGTLVGLAFEMPPEIVEPFLVLLDAAASTGVLRNFVAFEGGDPVASASLVVAAGVAGIHNVGVPPEHQGRGVGRAITAALMAEGSASGARTAVLKSTPAGMACYRGLGFEERCRVSVFEPTAG